MLSEFDTGISYFLSSSGIMSVQAEDKDENFAASLSVPVMLDMITVH